MLLDTILVKVYTILVKVCPDSSEVPLVKLYLEDLLLWFGEGISNEASQSIGPVIMNSYRLFSPATAHVWQLGHEA